MPTRASSLPPLTVRTKFWFEFDGQFVAGEGGILLLREIARSGSLARAADAVGWSYRHAWGYLRRAERALGVALTARRPGKGTARGLDLTGQGAALVRLADNASKRLTANMRSARLAVVLPKQTP